MTGGQQQKGRKQPGQHGLDAVPHRFGKAGPVHPPGAAQKLPDDVEQAVQTQRPGGVAVDRHADKGQHEQPAQPPGVQNNVGGVQHEGQQGGGIHPDQVDDAAGVDRCRIPGAHGGKQPADAAVMPHQIPAHHAPCRRGAQDQKPLLGQHPPPGGQQQCQSVQGAVDAVMEPGGGVDVGPPPARQVQGQQYPQAEQQTEPQGAAAFRRSGAWGHPRMLSRTAANSGLWAYRCAPMASMSR